MSLSLSQKAISAISRRSFVFPPWTEALVWTVGLLAVGLADPRTDGLLDLCLFKAVGLPGGPGCGMGHAIGFLFRGEWALAIDSHPFSPVVLAVLLTRIGSLVKHSFFTVQSP